MEKQLNPEEGTPILIHHHIPIIVTTAKLFRLKTNVSIESIKNAVDINELATSHQILFIEPKNTLELKKHAYKKLSDFETKYSTEYLTSKLNNKYKIHNRTFKYYKNKIADFPNGIIVMTHTKNGDSLKKLLKVLQQIAHPSKKMINHMKGFSLAIESYINS